jgi:hypothetical protein
VHIAPGDPIDSMVQPDTPPEVIDRVRAEYGLDRPLPVQFGVWILKVLQGDFGTSLRQGQPVFALVLQRIPATLALALLLVAVNLADRHLVSQAGRPRITVLLLQIGVDLTVAVATPWLLGAGVDHPVVLAEGAQRERVGDAGERLNRPIW